MSLPTAILAFDAAYRGHPKADVIVPAATWGAWRKVALKRPVCVVAGCRCPESCDGLCRRHWARAKALGFLDVRVGQLRQLAEGK